MKKTLFALTLALASLFPINSAHALAPKDSRLVAVFFYAQDCEPSKGLSTKFDALKAQFSQEPVLFVTFDHSTAAARNQSAMLAQTMDLDEVYTNENRESGTIILIDSANEKEIGRITPEMTEDQAKETVQNFLAQAAAL